MAGERQSFHPQTVLSANDASLQLSLTDGRVVQLAIMRDYVHLGGTVRDDNAQFDDIERRRNLASATFSRLRNALLFKGSGLFRPVANITSSIPPWGNGIGPACGLCWAFLAVV